MALLDDIITDADARSPTETENIKTNINSSLEAALHLSVERLFGMVHPSMQQTRLYVAVGVRFVNVYPFVKSSLVLVKSLGVHGRIDLTLIMSLRCIRKLKLQEHWLHSIKS